MLKTLIILILVCLFGGVLGLLPLGEAGAAPPGTGAALESQTLLQPVRTWRDCQRIARCKRCRPVFRCRSCTYRRQCRRGHCEWIDVCVWGKYLPVAPRGVPVY